jgi:uncharacterized protein
MFVVGTAATGHRWRAALAALVIAVGFAGFAPPVRAQQPSAAALAAAREIATLKCADALLRPLIAGVVERTKLALLQTNPMLEKEFNEVAAKLRAEYAPRNAELMNEIAKVYASRFTEQELKDVLVFYKTPAGRKMLAEEPRLVEQTMGTAQNWGTKLSEEVLVKFRAEMRKRGHEI